MTIKQNRVMNSLSKKNIAYLGFLGILCLISACKGMFDNIEPYASEVIYPGKYDTITAKIGFERVELDLLKVGRIPTSQISLGKSSKTVIEYDGKQMVIDSLVSWINVPDLKQSKLYRIRVYTLDEYDNKSVPQEIAVIPYTSSDLANLVVASPRVLTSPNAVVVDWTTSLSSILLDYRSLAYEYTDQDGKKITGTQGARPRIFAANLQAGQPFQLKMTHHVTPKVNGVPILDSVAVEMPLEISMPTSSTVFNPAERDILAANGITVFTADGVASYKKLYFPVHTNTLQDLFYFPNIEELDLTGGTLFPLKTLDYNRNNIVKTIGGGSYLPFIRKVSPISNENAQTMVDLLNLGFIKKIKYIPNSLGIDHLLKPFDEKGIVEWVTTPDESLIPMNFFLDGKVQDATGFALDVVNPATSYPAGTNIVNPFRVTMRGKNGSFVFVLPKEYRFNIAEYRYLKFKVYMPAKSTFDGIYAPYQRLWPRFMNYLWSFSNESSFGHEGWDSNPDNYRIPDASLEKWADVTVDISHRESSHNRVVVINIGREPSLNFSPPADMVYYFSNFRFSK
ncbi:DUF4998 domain-containing protein [Sphingobacterium griseoflavum]|uniref:Uncharacterized protein n=1 Tax=Sphingobacterium griseoflavum TaxID=1474952 RepID=A0ABQ3HXV4_9SPHI|nr:DUF4998 domain-containing protein [Sphingobacterium griseoflavum]GHE45530.1 hypothetical protein GCM10017764_30940 [Sphingobacterium griseoflavum]